MKLIDYVGFGAMAAIAVGVGLIYVPAGIIVAGVLALGFVFAYSRAAE